MVDVLSLDRNTILFFGNDLVTLLVKNPGPPPTSHCTGRLTHLRSCGRPPRVSMPRDTRSWAIYACHVNAFCDLGVYRPRWVVQSFYWRIGLDTSVHRWTHAYLLCQALTSMRHAVRWPVLSLPLTNAPGVVVGVLVSDRYPLPLGATPSFCCSRTALAAAPIWVLLQLRSSPPKARPTSPSPAI